jgi:hypothetical protein
MIGVGDRELARLAVEAGWLNVKSLRAAAVDAKGSGLSLIDVFNSAGITEYQVTYLLACALQLSFALPCHLKIDPAVSERLSVAEQKLYYAVPLKAQSDALGDMLYVAMLPEAASTLAPKLTQKFGMNVIPVAAPSSSIAAAIDIAMGKRMPISTDLTPADDVDFDAPANPAYAFELPEMPPSVAPAIPAGRQKHFS